jgi:hypothetical protein
MQAQGGYFKKIGCFEVKARRRSKIAKSHFFSFCWDLRVSSFGATLGNPEARSNGKRSSRGCGFGHRSRPTGCEAADAAAGHARAGNRDMAKDDGGAAEFLVSRLGKRAAPVLRSGPDLRGAGA